MDKITELKQYASEEFEKRKDATELRKVRGIILEAINEIIENYYQYIDKDSIDRALQMNYKVKIYAEKDEDSSGAYTHMDKIFDKNNKNIYGENGTILIYYPFDEYSEETAPQREEFDLNLDKNQSNFFNNNIVNLEQFKVEELTEEQKKENYNIKQNYFLTLQHEILHSMCKKEVAPHSKDIDTFFEIDSDLSKEKSFYLFDGGFPLEIVNLKNDKIIDYDNNSSQLYFLQLHEGLTEYLTFSMKKRPIERIIGFQSFGEGYKYASPAYGPFVWFMGALNALNNNKFMEAYFQGRKITSDEKNNFQNIIRDIKPFLECLNNIVTFTKEIDFLNSELLNFNTDELYRKLYGEKLSKHAIESKIVEIKNKILSEKGYEEIENSFYKTDSSTLTKNEDIIYYLAQMEIVRQEFSNNIDELQESLDYETDRFGDVFEKTLDYLYEKYSEKVKNKDLDNLQKKEFVKCFKNLLNFDYTWEEYLLSEAINPYYYFGNPIKKLSKKYKNKKNEQQLENSK